MRYYKSRSTKAQHTRPHPYKTPTWSQQRIMVKALHGQLLLAHSWQQTLDTKPSRNHVHRGKHHSQESTARQPVAALSGDVAHTARHACQLHSRPSPVHASMHSSKHSCMPPHASTHSQRTQSAHTVSHVVQLHHHHSTVSVNDTATATYNSNTAAKTATKHLPACLHLPLLQSCAAVRPQQPLQLLSCTAHTQEQHEAHELHAASNECMAARSKQPGATRYLEPIHMLIEAGALTAPPAPLQ